MYKQVLLSVFLLGPVVVDHCLAFTCTPDETWDFYRLPIDPVQFNGTDTAPNTTVPSASGCFLSVGTVTCGGPTSGTGILADGDPGPIELDISAVHAWNQNFSITFQFGASTLVTAVNLFFYNIPSMGVGLPPNIELFHGDTVVQDTPITNFIILNNQDLNQEDNQLRNVTLVVTDSSGPTYGFFRVQFSFSESHLIDWILLSEIQLCTSTSVTIPDLDSPSLVNDSSITVPLGPIDNVVSNYTLVCSIAGEGRFQWMWTFSSGSNVQFRKHDVDGTRTSIVELLQISAGNGYNGDYQCQPMYHTNALPSNTGLSIAPKVFTLDLRSDFSANDTTIRFTDDDTFVTVACELFGYVQSQDVSIMWRYDNRLISSEFPYEITTEDGDNVIQDGGTSTRPSLRSVLRVNVSSGRTVDGGYICQTQNHVIQITLIRTVSGGGGEATTPSIPPPSPLPTPTPTPSSPVTQSTSSSPRPPGSPISLNIIIGAGVGGAVVLVLIIMIILILTLCCCKRRMTHHPTDDKDGFGVSEPFYQEVSQPLPPPLPDRFPDLPGKESDYDSPDYSSGVTLTRTDNIGLKSNTAYATNQSITLTVGGGEAETTIGASEEIVKETNTAYANASHGDASSELCPYPMASHQDMSDIGLVRLDEIEEQYM